MAHKSRLDAASIVDVGYEGPVEDIRVDVLDGSITMECTAFINERVG